MLKFVGLDVLSRRDQFAQEENTVGVYILNRMGIGVFL